MRAFGECCLVEFDPHDSEKSPIHLLPGTQNKMRADPQWATVHSVGERVKDIETLAVGQRVYVAHAHAVHGPNAERPVLTDRGRTLTLISAREILAVAEANEMIAPPIFRAAAEA